MLWCAEKLKVQMKDACTDVDTAAGEHCEVIECLEAITALARPREEWSRFLYSAGPVLGGVLPAALVERGAWICPARSRVVADSA